VTPWKVAAAGTAIAALVFGFAAMRSPSAEQRPIRVTTVKVPAQEGRFDSTWNDVAVQAVKADAEPVRKIEIVRPEPRPVKTERIVLNEPEPIQVASAPPEVEAGPVWRKREKTRRGGDVCTRHGMRKVMTRGGKSWRCRK
jgi:hypothetical protein